MKPASLYDLKAVLESEGIFDAGEDFETRYAAAMKHPVVQKIIEIETPPVADLTDFLHIENTGKLYAVRFDLSKGVDNHKKPVVAGLILRGVLAGRIPKEGIDTLIDGGNYNSAMALKYYTEKFGMKGIYVMSRFFPQDIVDMLGAPHFEVMRAPKKYDNAREREFYEHIVELMRNSEFRKNKHCLWHARYSGRAMYPLGKALAGQLPVMPDAVVSCLGAGATLEGLQLAVEDYFYGKPRIVIAEHERSPLFAKIKPYTPSAGLLPIARSMLEGIDQHAYQRITEILTHAVLGPHVDEINQLLSKEAIARIDEVRQFSEQEWMVVQKYLQQQGISVGNSSAANISVAAHLANEGKSVMTVVFEPARTFLREPKLP
ncbi:pyridoxal-phosphate dependent enzyme [Candidatus Woesearchaeota archaeon]|nr:pyridoxal-phosphate dependent enzyme [Candidatus Woesearchaeota archaeon]